MNKSDIKYISLLAPLLYIYQNIFLWSKNISMFTYTQLLYSFGAILIISLLWYTLFYYLFSFLYLKVNHTKQLQLYIGVLVAAFIGIISNFFFLRTLFYPHNHFAMYVLMACIILIIYFNLSKYFLKFCYLLILFASCSFTYNMYKNITATIEDTDKFIVEFKDKPNIYMLWLESYHGIRTLNNVYHVDISPMTEFLKENNFTVCENIYSSTCSTLGSMTDLFSLGEINPYKFSFARSDVKSQIRKLIGGGTGNNVLKILKYNNYNTNVMLGGYYYFMEKGKYLDYAPIDAYDSSNILNSLRPCYVFSKNSSQFFANLLLFPEYILKGDFKENIALEIDKMQKMKQPYFLAVKYESTNHPTDQNYTYKQRTEWINSGLYKQQAEKSIVEIPELITLIIEKDPNALIVMLGDHGAMTYRGLRLNELSANDNIVYSDFIDDYFNVFGAVRLPEKYAKFSFENGDTYINHMNIFVHIFSLLAGDPEYLKLQKTPESRLWSGEIVVENGKIIEE